MMAAKLLRESKWEIPWAPIILSGPSFIFLLLYELGREGQDAKLQNESH